MARAAAEKFEQTEPVKKGGTNAMKSAVGKDARASLAKRKRTEPSV